jgi:hypothetical protein
VRPTTLTKVLNRHLASWFTCLIIFSTATARLKAEEFTQKSQYAVRMFSTGTLSMDTRTGDIRIEGWDTPRLEVEAERPSRRLPN